MEWRKPDRVRRRRSCQSLIENGKMEDWKIGAKLETSNLKRKELRAKSKAKKARGNPTNLKPVCPP